jgi:hypothetical protein
METIWLENIEKEFIESVKADCEKAFSLTHTNIMGRYGTVSEKMDELELVMQKYPAVDCPLTHIFTPGLYTRQIFMPAGSLVVSKIHRTEHPYIICQGEVSVFTEMDGEVLLKAPHTGITKPGTRRTLYCHTDVVWVTVHPITDGETLEEIEERIIEKHELKRKEVL